MSPVFKLCMVFSHSLGRKQPFTVRQKPAFYSYPEGGFRKEEALSREETLRGMTIWAAYSNFEEAEKGSIEAGKFADFIVLDTDIMACDENDIPKIKVLATYINGEKVF